jgi:hypothetical protein
VSGAGGDDQAALFLLAEYRVFALAALLAALLIRHQSPTGH